MRVLLFNVGRVPLLNPTIQLFFLHSEGLITPSWSKIRKAKRKGSGEVKEVED